jgi:hypothetical protein
MRRFHDESQKEQKSQSGHFADSTMNDFIRFPAENPVHRRRSLIAALKRTFRASAIQKAGAEISRRFDTPARRPLP